MNLLHHLKWRYATKYFDTSKKVSTENLDTLKEAIQLSASSYGLQLYKVLIIENREIREKLKLASWGQNQITDASHLIVFCNYTEVTSKHVNDYLRLAAKTQNLDATSLKGYGDSINQKITQMSKTERDNWTSRQTYLALGNLLNACAELKIDSCPMEGFEAEKYNDILKLNKENLNVSVIATIGYRSKKDDAQHRPKVRKPLHQLFEVL